MNALTQTFSDMTATLQKVADPTQQRVVHWCRSSYRHPNPTMHVVLIDRDYFRVNDREYALLKTGIEPIDLDLEPLDAEEIEAEDL